MSSSAHESPAPNVSYTMPKPLEWDNLMDRATDSIIPHASYAEQTSAPLAIWEDARKLSTEVFEKNRYYGLGLVACTFVRTVSGENKERFLAQTVDQLVDGHYHYCNSRGYPELHQGLYVKEINGTQISNVAQLKQEYSNMDIAERLIANTLEVHDARSPLIRRDLSDFALRKILDRDIALRTLTEASFAGATTIFRTTLQRMYEQETGNEWPHDSSLSNILVKDIATEEALRNIRLTRVGAIAATVRIDEFAGVTTLVTLDASGQPDIDRSQIPKEPKSVKVSRGIPEVAHTNRLGCPALYVGGAIPFVTRELPGIVANAQRRLLI